MTQVNTILKELRKELGEAMHLVVTSCGDTRCRWVGQRDALIRAIEIVEKATPQTTAELVAALKGREGVKAYDTPETSSCGAWVCEQSPGPGSSRWYERQLFDLPGSRTIIVLDKEPES